MAFTITIFIIILLGTIIRHFLQEKEHPPQNTIISITIIPIPTEQKEPEYWEGPVPSPEERNANQNWISDHLVKYPGSMAGFSEFPEAVNRAKAVIRYNEIERQRQAGLINDEEYRVELEKILPLIDISHDNL